MIKKAGIIWHRWMGEYPKKNGIYLIVFRKSNEVWVGYWNNNTRRFEEAIPEMTDRGLDVDYWAELPNPPKA